MDGKECLQGMDFMKDWKTWRETLNDGIQQARKFGVSDETIKKMSVKVGDFLATKVCPATKEEELLKEMWNIATPEERKTIAGLMFKIVE
jgi:sulfur relay (sulfurtransferase) DsrC/TusE family protein